MLEEDRQRFWYLFQMIAVITSNEEKTEKQDMNICKMEAC